MLRNTPCYSRVLTAALALVLGLPGARADDADIDLLLDGVQTIAMPGVPGPLAVTSDGAFAVWTGRMHGNLALPVVAAARHGEGRVLALGHPGYFGKQALADGDTAQLMANGARWLGGAEPRVACWRQPDLAASLRAHGLEVEAIDARDWMNALARVDVVFLAPSALDPGEVDRLDEWVAHGGSACLADLGWGWQQLHPRQVLAEDHPGNLFGAPLGLVWADGTFDRIDTAPIDRAALERTSAAHALQMLRARDATREREPLPAELGRVLTVAVRAVPASDERLLAPLVEWLDGRELAQPGPEHPLHPEDVAACLSIVVNHRRNAALPPDEVQPAPTAAHFPGAVPETAKRRRGVRIQISGVRGERISTGLYAAPGEVITLSVPASDTARGLRLRIGAHSDKLWQRPAWERHPEISASWPVDRKHLQVASPHGGLIYIELAKDTDDDLQWIIDGAVASPRFVLGRTTAREWRALRREPAPWAELQSRHMIVSVPSTEVRGLRDPTELLELWDRILATYGELDGRPLAARPERIVPDIDISAGYMHSGYPIMTHIDAAPWLVDHDRLLGRPEPQVWGLWHEIGHNRQHADWTFSGTVEVTCNLYTLFVLDRISGVPPAEHPRIPPLAERHAEYVRAGADFEQWKRSPFLALYMYVQLQEAFGWDAYQRVFASYLELPDGSRPRGDDAKRDLWLQTFSRVVERDLSGFFESWGVPTSQAARDSLADLDSWMP